MLRKFVLGTGALALGLGLAAGSGTGLAGATRIPVQLSGAVTCTTAVSVKFSPKLSNDGSAAEVLTLKARFSACTGAGATFGGVTLTGGSLVATTSSFATNCGAVLDGGSLPSFSGNVKWKGTGGPIAPSTVTVSRLTNLYSSSADTLTAYVGSTAVASGSFADQHLSFGAMSSNKDAYKITSTCGSPGIGSLKFGASGGTVSVGA